MKISAIIEGTITDARHAVGDCYARKPGATREDIIADARHAVTDYHARKPGALIEGIIAYARHTVRDCHALKPDATRESPPVDARHGFCVIFGRNNKFFIGASADSRHGIAVSITVQKIIKAFTWATNSTNYANAVFIIVFYKFAVFCVTFFASGLFGAGCRAAMAIFSFGMFAVERANPCMRICAFIFYPFSEVVCIWIYCNRQIVKRCFRFVFVVGKQFIARRTFVM